MVVQGLVCLFGETNTDVRSGAKGEHTQLKSQKVGH